MRSPNSPAPVDGLWLTTPRLLVRRPRPDDLADYVRLHTDPRTYAHAPASMPTPEGCAERLARDVEAWAEDGVGYAAVLDRGTDSVIGWAGLKTQEIEGEQSFNLYYRLSHDRLGTGLGREVARAVAAWAVEHRPERPVHALVDDVNAASMATAEAAGLVRVGPRRHVDAPADAKPMILFVSPAVRAVPAGEADVEGVVDLWVRVNDAGGSVGFLPAAPRDAVGVALEQHLADVRAGRAILCELRDPDGTLRGLGFWEHSRGFPYDHVAGLKRLMVDPAVQGRNLGRLLLGGMVGIARRELPGVELLRLDYREGLGLGEFYGRAGWTEVGRVPRGLKLTDTDYRDDVAMARRVDGAPLTEVPRVAGGPS